MRNCVYFFFSVLLCTTAVLGHEHHGHENHDHHHHHDAHHGHDHHEQKHDTVTIDRFDKHIWMEALFATALVGIAPILILTVVPLGVGDIEKQQPLLRVFLSFAAGGLLGDSFLHLLPHSMPSGHHHHNHKGHEGHHSHSLSDLAPWLWTLAGIIAFLMLEKLVRSHTHHSHSHAAHNEYKKTDGDAKKKKKCTKEVSPSHQIAAAGYLNLAADFSHNFTDGLAIGATFLQGTGWQTTVAMLLHEVPHEIGDFAILIQSGFSRKGAMWSQVSTALGAMLGTVIGLLMEGSGDQSAAWITPFTAGGFIYIACTSVFPEILQDCSLLQSIKELLAIGTGVSLMILIALYE